MGPPVASNPVQTAGIIMIVCALAIAIGTFTKSWFSASDDGATMGIGLTGMKAEGRGKSVSFSWGEMNDMARGEGKVPTDIMLFGYVGFIAGIGAVAAAGAAGGMALTRNLGKFPTKPALGVMGAASFAQAFFFVRVLTEDAITKTGRGPELGPSYSGILSLAGLIAAGIVFKQMLKPHVDAAKAALPAGPMMGYGQPVQGQPMMGQPQPMMGQPPVAQAQMMTCPRCQGQAAFVAQYNRYFCNACQQYV